MTDRAWVHTGDYTPIGDVDRTPAYDPATGEHLWTIFTAYRWGGPNVEQPMLDAENLLMITGPGCMYCEREYTPLRSGQRCPGPPRN